MKGLKWREAGILFLLLAGNYGLLVTNTRMIARGSYLGTGLTDTLIAWWGFTLVQRITKADTKLEKFGYVLGGVLGSLLALRLTK